MSANGLLSLSIPVVGGRNQRAMYRDVRIDYHADWQVRHWRSIFSAYGKSPWFFQFADSLEALYRHQDTFLVDWNFRCLEWVCSALKLPADAPILQACGQRDRRASVFPGADSGSPSPGSSYSAMASEAGERAAGRPDLDLADRVGPSRFQDHAFGPFPRYPQVFEDRWGFQPNLGALDLLCCCGPGAKNFLQLT